MAKISDQPKAPFFPWGGPASVNERIVRPAQLLDRKGIRKKGDPKNPALASAALLDFIGPGHTAEALRLPMPPAVPGHEAETSDFIDRSYLSAVAARIDDESRHEFDLAMGGISASPERVDRLNSLLQKEGEMLQLVAQVARDIEEIEQRRREEMQGEGI